MLDQYIIIGYLILILAVGLWVGRGMKKFSDFAVAGRQYGHLVIFATLAASFIGGGFSMGNAEKVFLIGLTNVFALWGFSLKEILVAKYIAPRMDNFRQAVSVGDVMETQYGRVGKVLTGLASIVLCAAILGVQVGAIGYVFNLFLDIPQLWGVLIGCGIVILYSTVGGMKAVIWTDVIQFIVLAIGIPVAVVLAYFEVGGWSAISAAVPVDHLTLLGERSWLMFGSLFLMFFFAEILLPPYAQRLFIGKDAGHTAKGTLWSGLFSIPFLFLTGFAGLLALTLDPTLDPNLSLPYIVQTMLPVGLAGIVAAGIISVVMSSADSFLNSASIALVHDVINPFKKLTAKQELLWARVTTLVVGAGAVYLALTIKSIFDLMIYAYNFWAPVMAVPLVAVILGVKAGIRSFVMGGLAAIAMMQIWDLAPGVLAEIDPIVIGVLTNLIVFSVMRKGE